MSVIARPRKKSPRHKEGPKGPKKEIKGNSEYIKSKTPEARRREIGRCEK
jgi:hypothetical protein